MSGFHPVQVSFLLRAASDTLATAILRHWCVQSVTPLALTTTAHILGGYPMALTQQRYTYHHNQVLLLLATKLKEMFTADKFICVYADLHGWRSSESPQATIPSALVSTPFRPNIVVHNSATLFVALLMSIRYRSQHYFC